MSIKPLRELKKKTQAAPKISLSQFFTKATESITQKTNSVWNKLTAKLSDTPAVVPAPSRSKQPTTLRHTSPLKDQVKQKSLSKAIPSKIRKEESLPELSEEKNAKLQSLLSRRQELMEKLRKIDHDLTNPYESRVSRGIGGPSSLSLANSGVQKQRASKGTEELKQHQKNLEMLTRINNEKLKRQERIVSQMKRKQQSELKKVQQIQRNKSKVMAERHNSRLNRQSKGKVGVKFNKFSDITDIEPISHLPLQPNSQPPTPPVQPYNEFASLEAPPTISSRIVAQEPEVKQPTEEAYEQAAFEEPVNEVVTGEKVVENQ